MTDNYNTLTVVLEKDIREDDAESLLNIIRCLKGVLRVKGNVTDASDYMAQERVRYELGIKLWNVIYPEIK